MSCGGSYRDRDDSFSPSRGDRDHGDCIVNIVKNIVKAQHRAVEAEEDTCFTSCDRSVADLLTDFKPNRRRLRFNTIPFILYCKSTCKPFIGSGIIRKYDSSADRTEFKCIESPVFRVKNFVRGSDHCVLLEILKPVYYRNTGSGGSDSSGGSSCCHKDACDFFKYGDVRNFKATGICITVDLRCFCGITCLDPITPIRANIEDRFDD